MITAEEVDSILEMEYSFTQRPKPVPGDGRAIWRVPYVLLIVRSCRNKAATLDQLHVLNWAVRSSSNAEEFQTLIGGHSGMNRPVARYEPALDRAVSLATAMKFVRYEAKKWTPTEGGEHLLASIGEDDDLFKREKALLASMEKPLTQANVNRIFDRSGSK